MRPIITFALTAVLTISFVACNNSVKNDDNNTIPPEEGCPECEHLAFWWVRHDEFIDWEGNVKYVDTAEYDYETMDKKYLCGEYTYVKGFYEVMR